MSERRDYRDSKTDDLPDKCKLYYNAKNGTSNLIDWNKDVTLHMERLFGSKVSSIFRNKTLPPYMVGPYVPDRDLPQGNEALAVEARKLDYSDWYTARKQFKQDAPKVISLLQTGTMTDSSRQRIKDTREVEMEDAIRNQDLIEVLALIQSSHQYRGRSYKVSDQRKVHREFSNFDYANDVSLVALNRRYTELGEKMRDFGVIESDFNKMYQFLMATAKYPNSRVSEQAMKYLGMADDPNRFPKSVHSVYEELISLEEVQNQIRADSKRDQSNAAGSVHVTSGKHSSKAKSSDGPVGRMSQVLSAHAAVNKSLKKKFEQKHQSNGSVGGNPFTDNSHVESEMLRTGKSFQDVKKGTTGPCHTCGRMGHLSKDCRARQGSNRTSTNSSRGSNNSNNRGSFRPPRPQSYSGNKNSNNKSSGRPFQRAGVHSAVGAGAGHGNEFDDALSESELSNWRASIYSLRGRIQSTEIDYDSDGASIPELISNSDSSSDEESASAGKYRTTDKDIRLSTKLNDKFLSHKDANLRAEGSSPPSTFVDQFLSSTFRAAISYGAHIPALVEDTSELTLSTQKDIQSYGLDIDENVITEVNSISEDKTVERTTVCPSESPEKTEFEQVQQEVPMRYNENSSRRLRSPPPPDPTSSATDSDASYRFKGSDADQLSESDQSVMKSYDFIGERQSQPYCIVINKSNQSNLVDNITKTCCESVHSKGHCPKRMRQEYFSNWSNRSTYLSGGQPLGAVRQETASAFTTRGIYDSPDPSVAAAAVEVKMQSDADSEPNSDEHVTPREYYSLLDAPTTPSARDLNRDESLPEPKFTDYPFPAEGFNCLMIADRVMVRFADSDTVGSWILARESNIPEIRRRWDSTVAFLTSGLEQLEEDEKGICFDYCRGSSHRAHGVFLPDEDPEGYHLGPKGEFLGRVRINNWLIAYGVWEFQFTLPSMAQTWAELEYLYRRVFPRHPFFNSDHSWNSYQHLLDCIHEHIENNDLDQQYHIWKFYNPMTRQYTFNNQEWGSPPSVQPPLIHQSVGREAREQARLERRRAAMTPTPDATRNNSHQLGMTAERSQTFDLREDQEVQECVPTKREDRPPLDLSRLRFFSISDIISLDTISDSEECPTSSTIDFNGAVNMAKHHNVSSSHTFNNHTHYCLDSMANVSVFRNPDLISSVGTSTRPLSIDGVGSKMTNVDQVGVHPLFGEVWYLPSNEYNIVSQWQAEKQGFLLKMSEDNKSCYLHRKSDNTMVRFERDPSDHFYKCPAVTGVNHNIGRAFEMNAEELHEAYSVRNESMYYSQEQLRRADIVESLHVSMEHPSDSQLSAFIQSPSSINMPVTVQDLHNLRAIKGPCTVCLEGRPKPHKGSHPSYHKDTEPTQPGELLHSDIVFIQGKPRLFTVDDVTGYMTLTMMDGKSKEELVDAYTQVINAYRSYLKVVRLISCDYESVLRACETSLNGIGVKMSFRIPGEHEKRAERSMRIVRERMRVKRRELPYTLPRKLYDSLAAECVRNINMMPNSKSMPYSPCELVRGEKVNFLTDISPPFGSLVLCPVSNQQYSSEVKQEVAVVLGPAGPTVRSGVKVYIPGKENPVIRRNIQPMSMTPHVIEHMNEWARVKPADDNGDFSFPDTIREETSGLNTFFIDGVSPPLAPASAPLHSGVSRASREDLSVLSQEFSRLQTDYKPTLVDIDYSTHQAPAPVRVQETTDAQRETVTSNLPTTAIPTPPMSRKLKGAPGVDPSNIISSEPGYGTRGRTRATVNQMSLSKSLQSEHSDAAIEAAKKELKQLVDLKTWVYIRSRQDASPSVHTRETPCSMFLKQKYNSRGEFLLWKARLVDGGHRTDPNKYDPFEKTSPTVSLEIVMILLCMAVKERLEMESFDVPGAYLNSSLQPGRFHMMRISKSIAKILTQVDPRARSFVQEDGSVLVEIRRSLYGLPEAAKLWNDYLTKALTDGGYRVCPHDPCLFIRRRGQTEVSIIAIYVDDCLHIYRGANIYRELYESLRRANLKDLKIDKLEARGSISFLGLSISRDKWNLFVNQEGYLTNLMDAFAEPYRLKPKTPLGEDGFKFPMDGPDSEAVEVTPFASQLMKVRYIERTRPDVSLALSALQTQMRAPTKLAVNKLRRVVGYLESTQDLGINIKPAEMKLYCYCDAGFAVHDKRESHSGILFTLGDFGNPILWKSIKQKLVATSSTEAELICMYDGMDYLLWMRRVLEWMGYPQETTKLYQDNTSTITMAHMGRGSSGSRTKHIDIRYFFIKQFIDAKIVEIDHLGTDHMLGDFFASPRQGQDFRRTRDIIMGYTD